MSNKYLFKTLIELYDYIQNYKINKQSGTAQSMGTVFVAEDKKFFYDSGTSKVILIDEGIFKLIRYLITYNKTLSEINVLIKENNINTDRFLDFINAENLLKGFNITSLHCDTFLRHVHSSINTGTTQIILELTEECNLRCQYCIYNENYKNNRNFGLKRMSKETAFKAIDFLVENGDKSEISITFYGGEPLLEFQLLKEVIEYSKLVMPERRKHFSFTTNLTLLTEEMANYFSTVENLSILCSIDGPKEIHDEHRKYRNGTGTFDNVYDNFKMLNTICKSNDTMSIALSLIHI